MIETRTVQMSVYIFVTLIILGNVHFRYTSILMVKKLLRPCLLQYNIMCSWYITNKFIHEIKNTHIVLLT